MQPQPISKTLMDMPFHLEHPLPALKSSEIGNLPATVFFPQAPISQRPLEDLKVSLRRVMLMAGVKGKNIPENEEKQVLLDYIARNYGRHSPEEIETAFNLAFTHQLDLDEKDIPCYENFSCIYFSRIMDGYRRALAKKVKAETARTLPALSAPRQLDQDAGMQDWLNQVILSVVNDNQDPEFIPYQLFDWLQNNGKIRKTGPEMDEALRQAVDRRVAYLTYMDIEHSSPENTQALAAFTRMKLAGCITGQETFIVMRLAKSMMLKEEILKQHSQKQQNQSNEQKTDPGQH